MTSTAIRSEVVGEFADWLAEFLPNDYYEQYRRYRWDLPLRRDYQRAAFEAGWLQPTWPREHGGRSLGLRDAMEIRIEAALRSAPEAAQHSGSRRRGAGHPPVRHARADRASAGALAAWRRMVGTGHVRTGSRIGFRRPAHPRRARRRRLPGQRPQDLDHSGSRIAVVHLICTHRSRRAETPRHLVPDPGSDSPGVRIEPIRMSSISDETFCEVFLDDVEVPAENLLGPVNGGWNVALASLHHERQMIWIMNWVEIKRGLDAVRRARHGSRGRPGSVRRARVATRRRRSATGHRIPRVWATNWPGGPVRKPTS